jgi:rod shape-determining protein MreC
MENLLTRYRNVSILVAILFAQVLGLAIQVRRARDSESTRLIRVWAVGAVTPFEKGIVSLQNSTFNVWHNYLYLRGVRQENRDLKYEIERLRLNQVRLAEDAEQARRLQALLGFREQFISKTMAAQVIGFSGSELSRAVYIDKGSKDGLERNMPVITADGIVGKVLRVYSSTSLVLLIDDQTSGVGAILEKSRLQGVLRGTPSGSVVLEKIMADEQVQPGEKVLTSGGDLIFPKGLPAGVVTSVSHGADSFLNVHIHPAANLSKLEEVLVITQKDEKAPVADQESPARAIDILTQRLPSVPDKPAGDAEKSNPSDDENPVSPAGATKPPATADQNSSRSAAMKKTGTPAESPAHPAAPGKTNSGANAGTLTKSVTASPATKPSVTNSPGTQPSSIKQAAHPENPPQ